MPVKRAPSSLFAERGPAEEVFCDCIFEGYQNAVRGLARVHAKPLSFQLCRCTCLHLGFCLYNQP